MHTKIRLSLIEQGRAAEWLTSSVLLSFAVFLAFPGDTLSSTNGYVGFRNLSFDEASLATPLALISASRMAALYINGNWRRSPVVRAFGAMVGTVVFFLLAVTFAWPWLSAGGLFQNKVGVSTGAAVYFVLAQFDLLAAFRSGADARISQRL